MPIKILDNTLFKIDQLTASYDKKGPAVTMNYGSSTACVICVSKQGLVKYEDLRLNEHDLAILVRGGNLDFPELGYSLQGVTNRQLAATPEFRNFTMTPPSYVQVWGMSVNQFGDNTLYVPQDSQKQSVLVPMKYIVQLENDGMCVMVQAEDGYREGDLMYSINGHLPIPIPALNINKWIPLRSGVQPVVIPKPGCEGKYVLD